MNYIGIKESSTVSGELPISQWDIYKVYTMSCMFNVSESYNGDFSQWDMSNVSDRYGSIVLFCYLQHWHSLGLFCIV